MTTLISRLRDFTAAGTADYTVGGSTYWTDDQLQVVLDRHRIEVFDEQLSPVREIDSSGSAIFREYRSAYTAFESTDGGTAIFVLRDSTGSRAGTADWTADYENGRITFSSDTGGTVYYLTGRSYDLNAAAADVWTQKASHVADRYSFTADGARFDISKMVEQYERRAARFRAQSRIGVREMVRDDLDLSGWQW